MNPAEEGSMAHLDRDKEHLVEREEDRNLQQNRQTARDRINPMLLVEPKHLLLQGFFVVFVAFAQDDHLGLQCFHLADRDIGFVGQRQEEKLDHDGERENGEPEVAEQARKVGDRVVNGLCDEVEPAEVYGEVEACNIVFLRVAIE